MLVIVTILLLLLIIIIVPEAQRGGPAAAVCDGADLRAQGPGNLSFMISYVIMDHV